MDPELQTLKSFVSGNSCKRVKTTLFDRNILTHIEGTFHNYLGI